MKNYIIFAPHIDDELLGCFTYLKSKSVKKVLYFFELSKERVEEAKRSADFFGFEPVFLKKITDASKHITEEDLLLVPHKKDNHPHHQIVNMYSSHLKNKKKYYSVDMRRNLTSLTPEDSTIKLSYLNEFYPSQKKLWTKNEKYILFESISDTDYDLWIYIKTDFVGLHSWKDCNIEDVKFLKTPHRHKIYVEVHIKVETNDRELEFFTLKKNVDEIIERLYGKDKIKNLENRSMEMICIDIQQELITEYANRDIRVLCSEDNEVGSYLKW